MKAYLCAAALALFAFSAIPAKAEYISYRHGSTGVRAAQYRLEALGYYFGRIDGKNGPVTRNAVAAFQRANGLPITGYLDASTQALLMPSVYAPYAYAYYYGNNGYATPITYVMPTVSYVYARPVYAQPVAYAAQLPVSAPLAYTYAIPDNVRLGE